MHLSPIIVVFSRVLKRRTEHETRSKRQIYLSRPLFHSTKMATNDKRLVLLVGVLAAGIFATAFASTQLLNANAQSPNETNGNSTVSASGTATTKVDPDRFSVTLGAETNGTTAQEAAERNAVLMEEIISALRALGISEDDISTSNYNVYPVYETRAGAEQCIMIYPPPPECLPSTVITGYKASNSMTVTLDAEGTIDAGQVIDTAIEAGANSVQGAYYFLSQERQLEVQDGLIREAINNARARADIAADTVGMEVTGVKSINLQDVYFPFFARESALAADTQILPGQQEVSMNVNVVFEMS